MKELVLDPRLAADCFVLGEIDLSLVLLMNNALVPWFILVPRVEVEELYRLTADERSALLDAVGEISSFVKEELHADKLNVAAIGNKVHQLHLHVVGRWATDYCWPEVVWGAEGSKEYSEEEVRDLVGRLAVRMKGRFEPASVDGARDSS